MLPEVYSEVPCSASDALVELDEQGARDALALTTSAVARLSQSSAVPASVKKDCIRKIAGSAAVPALLSIALREASTDQNRPTKSTKERHPSLEKCLSTLSPLPLSPARPTDHSGRTESTQDFSHEQSVRARVTTTDDASIRVTLSGLTPQLAEEISQALAAELGPPSSEPAVPEAGEQEAEQAYLPLNDRLLWQP